MGARGRSGMRAPLWCSCVGSLLPVRVLVRLHKVAMHDNTEGIGRIGTHAILTEARSAASTEPRIV
jgi:hypothetical protein